MKQIPHQERPRERLRRLGPQALSLAELLAVLLGKGTQKKPILQLSAEILQTFGGLEALSGASVNELAQLEGLGPVKAMQLNAAFEIARRCQISPTSEHNAIQTPKQAYDLFYPLFEERMGYKREMLGIIVLDRQQNILHKSIIGEGSLSKVLVSPRDVLFHVIKNQGDGFFIAHNHPSRILRPSKGDRQVTNRLHKAAKSLGVQLYDHLILGDKGSFYSLRCHQVYREGQNTPLEPEF